MRRQNSPGATREAALGPVRKNEWNRDRESSGRGAWQANWDVAPESGGGKECRDRRFRCEVLREGDSGWSKVVKREIRLGREPEQLADELSLADRIPFNQPSHAALSDHVHCLDALQRPPRTLKGSIALGQPNSLFDCSVILFNYVIEILA